ncbi:peroxiredoxin [Vulcanisaeta thermophila]|uniref:peroxiredoxin n=1 Tax=Vulcanisaeta thermophila TaxID=867917 RepID=UPI000853D352|nr:peroxiredoxin [Vulcanisaeta thermophila]
MPITIPSIGEKFPELNVMTTHGPMKLPDAFRGKWFVLFSHPGDFTPVCTTEFVSFAKHYEDFKRLNTELIGLSVDTDISHIEWVQWIENTLKVKIPFPIIADPLGNVSRALGMLHAESSTNTVRTVFIVDDKAVIRTILYYPLELGRNIPEILRIVRSLQLIDKYGVVMPANWPYNEIIGENVLNPPPHNVEEAPKRLQQYKGFAWWLTYRELPKEEVEETKKIIKIRIE